MGLTAAQYKAPTKQRKEQPEFLLQCQVSSYLKVQYPKIGFLSDTVASVKLTMQQATRNKKIQCEGFKCPDLIIFATREIDGARFSGLLIELKAESPYLKNGKGLSKKQHIQAQGKELDRLASEGYFTAFAWSFEMAKGIIDKYLKGQL
jgi:hypothetical protein